MKRFARCPFCAQSTRLRTSGNHTVVGTMYKHRIFNSGGQWCEGGGDPPPPAEYIKPLELDTPRKARRTTCHVCSRSVAVRPDNTLYNHNDPHDGVPCGGSQTDAGPDPTDNTTSSISGFASWSEDDDDTDGRAKLPAEILSDWWIKKARAEADMMCAKAVEYGATDLRDLGYQVLEMAGRRPTPDPYDGDQTHWDGYATEVGIVFYAQGKLARIVAAIKEGRRPSYDSWLDLGVYARMAQRVHEHGGWPAV